MWQIASFHSGRSGVMLGDCRVAVFQDSKTVRSVALGTVAPGLGGDSRIPHAADAARATFSRRSAAARSAGRAHRRAGGPSSDRHATN